jgi:hypothetical protein
MSLEQAGVIPARCDWLPRAAGIGAEVSVTLEIAMTLPDGAPEQIVRAVTENSRTLKFGSHGFDYVELPGNDFVSEVTTSIPR